MQKLNDYIIYEYTKNKMQISKENNKKPSTSFLLPLPYRRMGNHGKKEDLIPINNKPKVNLEDILILHNNFFLYSAPLLHLTTIHFLF